MSKDEDFRLLVGRLEHQLRECNEALSRFEAKYGLTFADFARTWQEDKIPNKHPHEVERDFMEWKARHIEKEDLLAVARELGQPEPQLEGQIRCLMFSSISPMTFCSPSANCPESLRKSCVW